MKNPDPEKMKINLVPRPLDRLKSNVQELWNNPKPEVLEFNLGLSIYEIEDGEKTAAVNHSLGSGCLCLGIFFHQSLNFGLQTAILLGPKCTAHDREIGLFQSSWTLDFKRSRGLGTRLHKTQVYYMNEKQEM